MPTIYDTRDAGPVVVPTAAEYLAQARRHTLEALWAKLNHERWTDLATEAEWSRRLAWAAEHRNGKRKKRKR